VDESSAGGDGWSTSVVRPRALPCESSCVVWVFRHEIVENLSLATVLTVSKVLDTIVEVSASLHARDATVDDV
jgi:hypothetical protein